MNRPSHQMNAAVKRIQVRKEDSAYVYALFESYGDLATLTTEDGPKESPSRVIEVMHSRDFSKEVATLIQDLGELAHELA